MQPPFLLHFPVLRKLACYNLISTRFYFKRVCAGINRARNITAIMITLLHFGWILNMYFQRIHTCINRHANIRVLIMKVLAHNICPVVRTMDGRFC